MPNLKRWFEASARRPAQAAYAKGKPLGTRPAVTMPAGTVLFQSDRGQTLARLHPLSPPQPRSERAPASSDAGAFISDKKKLHRRQRRSFGIAGSW